MSRTSKSNPTSGGELPQYYQVGYPYQVPSSYQISSSNQRPSSAGATRSRSATNNQTSATNSNVYGGANGNPLNNVGLSGYNFQGYPSSGSSGQYARPGSAGATRAASSHTQPYFHHTATATQQPTISTQQQQQHMQQPKSTTNTHHILPTNIVSTNNINLNNPQSQTHAHGQTHHVQTTAQVQLPTQTYSSSRPKSAGGYRRTGPENATTIPNNDFANRADAMQYYLQQQQQQQQQHVSHKIPTLTGTAPAISSSSGNKPNSILIGQSNNPSTIGTGVNGGEHWNTSYNLHYGYSTSGNNNNNSNNAAPTGGSSVSKKSTLPVAVGNKISDPNEARPTSEVKIITSNGTGYSTIRPSSASATSSRIRNAISESQKYSGVSAGVPDVSVQVHAPRAQPAIAAVNLLDEDVEVDLGGEEDGEMGLDAEVAVGTVTVGGGRQILHRDRDNNDDDEMDGKRVHIHASRSHPEVSTTTPSHSLDLNGVGQSDDFRNSSVDSFADEDINIGLPTVPNQFCTKRDAIGLRKLILMSNSNLGGIAPSSSAVMDMYMVGKVIGVGSYGKVRAAWHRLTTSKVAIKTYDKAKMKDPSHWKRVYSEIKIMEQVSHPRIARMYEAIETPKRMHLIMECLDGGNLCSYVKQKRRLSEDESRRIFFQILQAVEYLHSMGVSHRDIKLENVLFVDTKDIKLIDFGFSTVCQPGKRLKVFCGTPSYMAPEIVRRSEYEGKPVDMWSLGILLYALLCGCFPFRAKTYPDLYRRIARGIFIIPEELSSGVKDLLRQLLCVDVTQRLTSQAALRHSWLQHQLLQAPDLNKMRKETPILISDRPADDIDEETLSAVQTYGISRDEVIRAILTKIHSSVTTLYYLLLDVNMTRRRSGGGGGVGGGGSNGMLPITGTIKKPLMKNLTVTVTGGANAGASEQRQPSNATGTAANDALTIQYMQRHQAGGAADGTYQRPKSASAGGYTSAAQRPLSAYAGRK